HRPRLAEQHVVKTRLALAKSNQRRDPKMPDVEPGGAAILVEVPSIERTGLCVGRDVQDLAVRVGTHHHEATRKALGHFYLHRIVGGPTALVACDRPRSRGEILMYGRWRSEFVTPTVGGAGLISCFIIRWLQ